VIKFSIDNAQDSRAVNAVVNLKRSLLPTSSRSRRNADTTPRLLTSRIDNQTITPTGIYNWTGELFSINGLNRILKKNVDITGKTGFKYVTD